MPPPSLGGVETGHAVADVGKQTCVAVSQHSMPPLTGPQADWHSVSLVHFSDVQEEPVSEGGVVPSVPPPESEGGGAYWSWPGE
jgi:hypothetical protein